MGKTWIAGGFAAVLMLALGSAESVAQEAEAPAAAAEGGLLQQHGLDARPSGELGLEELQARILNLEYALEHGGLADDAKAQATALLTADRAELAQRQAAATPAEPEAEAEQPAEAAPASPDQPAATAEPPAAEEPAATTTEEPPQATEQAAPAASEAPTETPSQETAEPPAAATEPPAQPVETPPPPPATTADEPAATAAPEQPAATTEAAPPPEAPASVEAPPQVSAAAEEQAAALLADKTPAESLGDEELKARVERSRALLDEPELSRKTAKALRQRLKADRQALRARVAAQEAAEAQQQAEAAAAQQAAPEQPAPTATSEPTQQLQGTATQQAPLASAPAAQSKQQQALTAQPAATAAPEDAPLEIAPLLPLVLAPTLAELPLLLQDRRPAQDLADNELNRRILAQREALQDEENYSADDLTLFDRQLREDREELNNRLLADRSERAAVYKEWRNPNVEMNTAPDPGEPQAPNSIFAAEVDDEEMWDQLTAAPLEPLPRRYSRHQVVEEPDFVMNLEEVREAMPSIELDTITFGFNEAFVREEEIFDLDRIARMIESVVAAHPDEIFMIEGHTDAVGSDGYNLRLSRQRALAVKAALTRYYLIPPESLATVGLGERYLKIWTPEPEEENRRVTVRRVTPLVTGYALDE
jgi:outer membrane protein OmpA-like peptidoglycan-associated protein